jgi:dihydroorotate dehydrogenase (fumarate)
MIDLRTKFMGLELKSPIIAGSSGFTSNLESIIDLEMHGAGAVVIKSLFEEQIMHDIQKTVEKDNANPYSQAYDYISNYSRHHHIDEYLNLIRKCKRSVHIPVMASINCVTAEEWTSFATSIQQAGADAIQLNIFVMPSDANHTAEQNEKVYFDILEDVLRRVTIPVSIKISYYFSAMGKTVQKFAWAGAQGIVLFNRFCSPDIDIKEQKVVTSNIFSSPGEIALPLRWIAMLSDRVQCDFVASTGVHDGEALIKVLLAGAKAAEVASTLYINGSGRINLMLDDLKKWMERNGYSSLPDFTGTMSHKKTGNPAAYERVQFMKHIAGIE